LLYWRFMMVNESRLAKNPRMAMPYRTLAKMTQERRDTILQEADAFLEALATGTEARATGQATLDL
jgi:deoxyribodipyrimidine photolyase-related protein